MRSNLTIENNGMLNLSNAVDISFNTGPREVQKVELIFKESASDVLYIMILYKDRAIMGG
jgi:hypothetical protein